MTVNNVAKGLWVEDQAVPLKGLNVTGSIGRSISEITLEQTYRNDEPVAIEAVYSFPIPMHAVLLDVSIRIADRELTGQVSAKNKAEESYERAVEDGDTAMFVRKVSDCLYSVSLGNLQPEESASIRYRFVMLNRWSNDSLRFSLPTVISDRYGDPQTSGCEIHESPWTDLSVTHPFTLDIKVDESLEHAELESPTHAVNIYRDNAERGIRLSSEVGFLERDFVLHLSDSSHSSFIGLTVDSDPFSESFINQLTVQQDISNLVGQVDPVSVKIVVDCSGSMGGSSITQARQALHKIVEALGPDDEFTIIKFGSNHVALSDEMLPVSPDNIAQAERFIMQIESDMGGTEIGSALNRAYQTPGSLERKPFVLLITDGAVWGEDKVISGAKQSEHCVFTVGVGSAVSEQLVRGLAESTGGQYALVTPNESMSDSIVRQFRLMRQPTVVIEVDWGVDGLAVCEGAPTLMGGESKAIFFVSHEPILEMVNVNLYREDQPQTVLELKANLTADNCSADARSRVCASVGLASLDESEQQAVAVQYQLFTEKTAMTIVDEREVKSEGIPELRSVPQMAAAGHMGFGYAQDVPTVIRARKNMSMSYESTRLSIDKASISDDMCFLDMPSFLLSSDEEFDLPTEKEVSSFDPQAFTRWLNNRVKMQHGRLDGMSLPTLDELAEQIPEAIVEELRLFIGSASEPQVVGLFLSALFEQCDQFAPNRAIRRLAMIEGGKIESRVVENGVRQLLTSCTVGTI